MEKFIIWYFLSLKENLKKRGSWLATFGVLFLIWIVSDISVPKYENMQVGIWCQDGVYTKAIKAELFSDKNLFSFVEYEEQQVLTEDVLNGSIDCGFIFVENFDEKLETKRIRDAIIYIATPFSSKGFVAKEKVYAAFLKQYSKKILSSLEDEIFLIEDETRISRISDMNQRYQEGTEIFHIEIKEINQNTEKKDNISEKKIIRGLIGLFLFLTMFLSYGTTRLKEGDNVEAALNKKERFCYRYVKMMSAIFLPSAFGILILLNYSQSRGMIHEICHLMVFLLISALWISFVGLGLGRAEHLPLWIFSLIIVHLLICPIFYDVSQHISAMKWIRNILPLTMYLKG